MIVLFLFRLSVGYLSSFGMAFLTKVSVRCSLIVNGRIRGGFEADGEGEGEGVEVRIVVLRIGEVEGVGCIDTQPGPRSGHFRGPLSDGAV